MEKENAVQTPQSQAGAIFEIIERVILCAAAVIILLALGIRMCAVDGDSMNDTLQNGDILITNDIFYEPKQDDIVVFHLNNDYYQQPLIKRVIATEGQWIDIKKVGNGLSVTVYEKDDVNFENPIVYEDEHAYYDPRYIINAYAGVYEYPVQVPEGKIFVMGDNRWNSSDSRLERVGFVDTRIVFGKVCFRLSPITKMGFPS